MRHRWTNFSGGLWLVGPSEDNPEGSLRRAKGAAPLRSIALRSRSGTLSYFSLSAHSMTRFNGEYVIGHGTSLSVSVSRAINSNVAIDDSAVFNGNPLTFVQMPPTTVGLGTAGYVDHLFVAGGGELRKIDPAFNSTTAPAATPTTEWGIEPPDISNATATLVAQTSAHNDGFDSGAPTGWAESAESAGNYALSLDTTRQLTGAGCMRLGSIKKDSTAEADKTGLSQDWTNIGGGAGSSPLEDFVSFAIRINRPKHVKSVSITFAVVAGDTAFRKKSFSRELKVRVVRKKRKRKLIGSGDIIRKKDQKKFVQEKKTLPRDRSTQEFLTEDTIAVVRRRWTRVTIPKATFEANGGADPDADWATVTGIRFEVETNKQGTANVNIDDLALVGGVGMQGDYQYNITYLNSATGTRSNPDLSNTIDIKDIERQAVTLKSIPFSSDVQVDKVEIWRTLGNGEVFFKEQEVNNTDNGGGLLADVTSNVADYIGMFEGATTTLDPDLELPLDNVKPDDTFEDAVGPHVGRMWWTRDTAAGKKGRVYYSPVGRAEAVAGFIDLASDEDEAQKLVRWNEQLWCFTKRGVHRIVGTSEPFTFTEVWGAPGTDQPFSVVAAPEGIFYAAKDGVRRLGAVGSTLVPQTDPLAPIFRGGTTDGFAVTFTGEVAAYGRSEYYISDTTDSTRTTLAVNTQTGAWREIGFPSKFLFYDAKDNILFGRNVPSTVGDVLIIRPATHAGNITISTAAPFMPVGTPFVIAGATHNDGRTLVPRDITITRLSAVPIAVPGAGETVTLQFNVDGTTSTALQLSFTNADSANVAKSVTGTLSVSAGSTLSIEVTYVTATSIQLRSVGVAYSVPVE